MGHSDCGTWWVEQVLLYPVCGQMFAARGFNTVQLHHLPPLVCFRPCRQRNRTDNSTRIDHQGRLSPSVSLCIFFSFLAVFLAISWDLLRQREKLNIRNARQPSKDLSFVLCTNHGESYRDCSLFIYFALFLFCVSSSCSIKFAGETEGEGNRQPETGRKKKKKTHSQLWVWGNDQKRDV